MTRYISVADTAKIIRKELKTHFPGIKFSVRSRSYAGGASIDIEWNDGPADPSVDKVIHRFKGARFDGSTDSQSYVDAEWEGEEVRFGSDYVSCRRNKSRAFVEAIVAQFCRNWGISPENIKISGSETDAGIHAYSLPYHEDRELTALLYNTDAKEMHRAYEAQEENEQRSREEWIRNEPQRRAQQERNEAEEARLEAERERVERAREEVRRQQEEQERRQRTRFQEQGTLATRQQALVYLGLPNQATPNEIMQAFRAKVRNASDGKGGYTADMDLLVKAKEKALQEGRG